MQSKGYEIIKTELKDALKRHFGDAIEDFMMSAYTDTPHVMFRLEFTVYRFFNVVLEYDRGRFGCCIPSGNIMISLLNSQKWYGEADLEKYCEELDEQIRLRIPDKYLIFNNWK